MIAGIGIDIIELERIGTALGRPGFAKRVFTPAERVYCEGRGVQRIASYAARYAGKEALMKAFGTGLAGGSWQDIEILPDSQGRPLAALSGDFGRLAAQRGITAVQVSLSHSRDYAVGQAILWGGATE